MVTAVMNSTVTGDLHEEAEENKELLKTRNETRTRDGLEEQGTTIKRPSFSKSPRLHCGACISKEEVGSRHYSSAVVVPPTLAPHFSRSGNSNSNSRNANSVKVRFGTTQLLPSAALTTGLSSSSRRERSSVRNERLPEPSAVVGSKYSHEQLGNIYPFSYSLISNATTTAGSQYYPYSLSSSEPGISRHIDISSSSSIFYTVPLPKPKPTEVLGTPSILKPFRQLQEPTRFNTSKTARPNIYVPPVRVSRRRKSESNSEVSDSGTASVRSSVTVASHITNNNSVRSESRQTGLSNSPDLQVQRKPFSTATESSPKATMPFRVRMRRDEYYYTETSTKATQTDETELKEKRRRSSSSNVSVTTSGRRISRAETVDRSTSPISQLSSAHYLKKLEDLEKITGHFVIQRFFTRTDQDFTLWLEQQLASKSAEQGDVPEESQPLESEEVEEVREIETEDVPKQLSLQDASQIEDLTEVENSDTNAIIPGDSNADTDVTATTVEAADGATSHDPELGPVLLVVPQDSSSESPRITDVPRPAAIDKIDELIEGAIPEVTAPETPIPPEVTVTEDLTTDVQTEEVIEDLSPEDAKPEEATSGDPVLETISEGADVIHSDVKSSEIIEVVTIVEVHPEPKSEPTPSEELDSQVVPSSAEPSPSFVITEADPPTEVAEIKPTLETLQEEESKQEEIEITENKLLRKCTLSDLIPCECFAKHFLQEESIAKLLISLSPRTSTPIVEQEIVPIKIGHDATAAALDSFEKFQATLKANSQESGDRLGKSEERKIKHSESFAYGSGPFFSVETTVLSMEGHVTCHEYPPFVFPGHPHVGHNVRKSNSYDSCLGTELSSIKTSHDSGNSTCGRMVDAAQGKAADNLNISQDSHSQTMEDLKASIEEEVASKDSGMGSSSGRSHWFGSTDIEQGTSGRQETVTTIYEINSEETGNESVRAKSAKDQKSTTGVNENEIFSADSDTESEMVMSENYHARSEAESDTEITTDGDAVADDNLGFTAAEEAIDEMIQNGDDDNTDVDDDDKDNDLLARMELDELRLEIDKPSTIRTTCTQTNRSLFSSAWSNASSASSTTTNGSGSYIDLEVISKKYPSGPSADTNRRNYLPSSSSSLNYVNCNMNFSVKTDESKFKMSVTLPGLRPKQIQGGSRPLNQRKLPHLRSEEHQDLPALWAHVRNRLDSKVSLDIPASDLAVKGDSLPGNSRSMKELHSHGLRESNRESIRERATQGKYQRPTHQTHQQYFLQNRHNDDRIKRSLERLSKLLDIEKT